MTYSIRFTPAARRQLRKLDHELRRRVSRRIDSLAAEPRPDGVKKLTDVPPPLYRVREGDIRIVYSLRDEEVTVLIAHRGDAYR